MGLFSRKSPPPEPKRMVFMVRHDRELQIIEALKSQAGWYVEHIAGDFSLLLPGGKTVGRNGVASWFPHSGWPEDCLSQFDELKSQLANELRE
jgi:hypothetical protein